MIVLLVFLALLLCSGSYLLLRFVQPAGEIATTEEAQGIDWVRSIYGWGDGPDQQLQNPASVAIDSSGRILVPSVVDTSQIYRFGADGGFVDSFFGNEAEGRVLFPTGFGRGTGRLDLRGPGDAGQPARAHARRHADGASGGR